MQIKIMSRKAIEKFCAIPLSERIAVISICDYGDEFASLLFKPDCLLQIAFDDVDADVLVDVLGDFLHHIETYCLISSHSR